MQVSVSKARAIIVLASDENADQVLSSQMNLQALNNQIIGLIIPMFFFLLE